MILRSLFLSSLALVLSAQEPASKPQAAAAPADAGQTKKEGKEHVYIAKKGDSLHSISKEKAVPYGRLMNLNPTIAKRELYPGDRVVLGMEGAGVAAPSAGVAVPGPRKAKKAAAVAAPAVAVPAAPVPVVSAVPLDSAEVKPTASRWIAGDAIRLAYQAHRIYHFQVVKGAPLMIELPLGEVVKNVWVDKQWFLGEAVPGASRVVLKAQNAEGVEGQKTTVHIETRNDLRLSAVLECVNTPDRGRSMPPSVFSFYMTGQDEEVARRQIIQEKASAQAEEYQAAIDAKTKTAFESWQVEAMAKLRDNYKVNGPLPVSKVVDNGVRTWIFVTGVSQINGLKLINREKKEEVIDFEFLNGAYVVNRTLKEGERFELDFGKDKTQIVLK